jgi:glycosyltransferase involved in cell wall biosynthesis
LKKTAYTKSWWKCKHSMTDKPLVSIALCTYNGERFLREQLDSIVNQTYSPLEVIIVDDCSTDNTLQLITTYAERYDFIKIFRNAENLGYVRNFEKALLLCNGELISLCDQDDIWLSDKIQRQVEAIGSNLMIYHNSEFVDVSGNSLNKRMSDVVNLYRGDDPKSFLLFNCISGHSVLLKRELRDELIPFPSGNFHDWWIGYVATNLGSIDFLDDCLVKYRQHQQNSTNILKLKGKSSPKKLSNSAKNYEMRILWWKTCAEYPKNKYPVFVTQFYQEVIKGLNSYISFSFAQLLYDNRKVLFAIRKKSSLSKFAFILKEIWGMKIKRLFSSL